MWAGWINPEYYSEPFVTYPHTITIHAVDGLAELKNVLLPTPEVVDLNFKQNAMYYIMVCLNKIGLISPNRNLHVALNLVAKKQDVTLISSRILEEMYFDFRAFQDEDGTMFNCWDVLNEILSSINARIYQDEFQWTIVRQDHRHTDYTIEYYSIELGTYMGAGTSNDVVSLTTNSGWGTTLRFLHSANLEVEPAAKKYTISQPFGLRENLINSSSIVPFKDNDFDSTTGYLKYWTFYNSTVDHVKDNQVAAPTPPDQSIESLFSLLSFM